MSVAKSASATTSEQLVDPYYPDNTCGTVYSPVRDSTGEDVKVMTHRPAHPTQHPTPPLPLPPHFCFPRSCLCPSKSRVLFDPPVNPSPAAGDRGMGRGRVLYFLLSTRSPLFNFCWGEETWVGRGEGLWAGPALRGCIAGRT